MIPVSVIILTKNEEKKIIDCLKGLKDFNEIIAIDDNSTDSTIEKIKSFDKTIKVIDKSLDGSFSEQRNFGLSKSKNEWVFFVDADEVVSKKLAEEIEKKISEKNIDGYLIRREDIFLGKKMKGGDVGNVWLTRLGKKSKGKWKGDVHEEWKIDGNISRLVNPIRHNSHKNLKAFIEKINFYSTLRARELKSKGITCSFLDIILYPKLKFINLYFIKMGFRDGLHGLVHAIFMSMYSFLVRGKLYQMNRNDK